MFFFLDNCHIFRAMPQTFRQSTLFDLKTVAEAMGWILKSLNSIIHSAVMPARYCGLISRNSLHIFQIDRGVQASECVQQVCRWDIDSV